MIDTHYGDRRTGPFGAQFVIRSATVTSRMRLVHFTKIKRSVSPVEDSLHVVRIKEKSILFPTKIRKRRIRPEVAV